MSAVQVSPSSSFLPAAPHTSVILFYKYFVCPDSATNSSATNGGSSNSSPSSAAYDWLQRYPDFCLDQIYRFQKELCHRLQLKGRILLAAEGINGTLSAVSREPLQEYERCMEAFDLLEFCAGCGSLPPDAAAVPLEEAGEGNSACATATELCSTANAENIIPQRFLFAGIDWKASSLQPSSSSSAFCAVVEPFPDLKISVVKELVSTGGTVETQEIANHGGTHLTPRQFHQMLVDHQEHLRRQSSSSSPLTPQPSPENGADNSAGKTTLKDVVLIDVRNTFEYDIGHFVHPATREAAMNPEMTTFSSFEGQFCDKQAAHLRDKTVLMYCTGGIRCEKASVMLKRRGVQDVYQLQGGIHRYLEEFGDDGFFRGRNFVFDQRVSLTPAEQKQQYQQLLAQQSSLAKTQPPHEENGVPLESSNSEAINSSCNDKSKETCVGKCVECQAPYDELSGSRTCTVCRDLVLVCPPCQAKLREFHCRRHAPWKHCYFAFLEAYPLEELQHQLSELHRIRNAMVPPKQFRHPRRTLHRQIAKVEERLAAVQSDAGIVDPNAPRRCRTCLEPNTVCSGLCWGFWRTSAAAQQAIGGHQSSGDALSTTATTAGGEDNASSVDHIAVILPVSIGDRVEPGPDWNPVRLGDRCDGRAVLLRGTVVEIKSWGVGSAEGDCVVVAWDNVGVNGHEPSTGACRGDIHTRDNAGNSGQETNHPPHSRVLLPIRRQPQIYRWGVPALNGLRMYDVQHVQQNAGDKPQLAH